VLLIDDFYGWIAYGYLLRLLDGHPVQMETKGGHTHACWETVIITSNVLVIAWYQNVDDIRALERRINETVMF